MNIADITLKAWLNVTETDRCVCPKSQKNGFKKGSNC